LLEGSKLYLPVFHLFCEHHFLHLFWVPWPAMLLLILGRQIKNQILPSQCVCEHQYNRNAE
jgi:hypothetical protein